MTAHLTHEDMYQEYENERDYYHDLIDDFALEAKNKMGEYTELVCEAFTQDCPFARKIFKEKNLRPIHAYAVNKDFTDFMLEYDEQESYTREY